jgi:hypothetical protein
MDAQRFLAMEEALGEGIPTLPFLPLQDQYAQRVASTEMAAEAIPQVGAAWPPSLLDSRQDLQVFQLRGGEGPAVIATFLHGDRFTLNPAPHDAYSLLVLGEPQAGAYGRTFAWYRLVGASGKAAPRFFSHLDWDEDGQDEILLEVFGDGARWWAGLDRGADGWRIAFEDSCPPADLESPSNPSGL